MQAQPVNLLNLLNGDVQYKIPRWQRRYCWGQEDIERLIEDLKTIAASEPGSTHYTGTLLTLRENVPQGSVSLYRVVDGQQRLTTVSILLACIAELIGDDQQVGEWTKTSIRNKRLLNLDVDHAQRHKLRLQPEDHVEYESGLEGKPTGSGAVTQAWRITRRLLAKADLNQLLTGIERIQVVSIGLNIKDDPQQIFESINATGRPLTESEKVKNWLLIGLQEDEQNDLYEKDWRCIESNLGADQTSQPIDVFLRDFLRWQTGKSKSSERVYDEFRRWAIRNNKHQNRPELCHELAYFSKLYGYITGTAGTHPNDAIKCELDHLRRMSIDSHRPFTLRLMADFEKHHDELSSETELAETLSYISAWITRLWLADRSMTSLNTAFTGLAYRKTNLGIAERAEYWHSRICARRNSKIGVPTDQEVISGVRTRSGYGGAASNSTYAVLYALICKEHGSESIEYKRLSIEHVMPQMLTDKWKKHLGKEAESIHAQYRNRLGNLTLCCDIINSKVGTRAFKEKKRIYEEESTIGMTKSIAKYVRWDDKSINTRGNELAEQCLILWPWKDDIPPSDTPNALEPEFWKKLKKLGGVPGQKDDWYGNVQYSSDGKGDHVGISLLPDKTLMYIRSRDVKDEESSIARMKRHSRNIQDNMSDQPATGEVNFEARQGRSLSISRSYVLEDTEEWNDAVNWIQDQCTRLNQIIDSDSRQEQ